MHENTNSAGTSYFSNCHDLNELKGEYRRLAQKHHPDHGGDLRTMQEINAAHDEAFKRLRDEQNRRAALPNSKVRPTTETPEEFRNIIDLLMRLDGVTAELCGSWLWISGNTYPNRNALKEAGCIYSHKKRKWYWRHPENWSRRGRGSTSMEKIRARYGSQQVIDQNDSGATLPVPAA